MSIRVIAKKNVLDQIKVYYLNLSEPKLHQLYMAILNGKSIETITVYNVKTDNFEDVSALFQPSFMKELFLQISNQLPDHIQSKAL